jgi:alkylation response protein AidB-like acyl-CoA dehydrogenase
MSEIYSSIFEAFEQQKHTIQNIAVRCDQNQSFDSEILMLVSGSDNLALAESISGERPLLPQEEESIFFEASRYCSTVRNYFLVSIGMVAGTILKFGSASQKQRCRDLLVSGNFVASLAITEPEVGSNIAEMRTQYEINGDQVTITGVKRWITLGGVANLFLIAANGDHGILTFMLDRETGAIKRKSMKNILSNRGSEIAELHIDELEIPITSIVGNDFKKSRDALDFALLNGRAIVGTAAAAMANSAIQEAIQYAKTRKQFGNRIWQHQLIQKLISDSCIRVSAARALSLKSFADKRLSGLGAMPQCMQSKLFSSEVIQKVSINAMQVFGGNGMTQERNVERYYREARAFSYIEGSDEVLTQAVARNAMIGLPAFGS